jgi:hypothetical protein
MQVGCVPTTDWPAGRLLPAIGDQRAAGALEQAFQGIAARYGMSTADFVAMQFEYPRRRETHEMQGKQIQCRQYARPADQGRASIDCGKST